MANKLIAFEYAIIKFLAWKAELSDKHINESSLSKTQALKLLFLLSANSRGGDKDLLDIFDKFYAMQFGPVESDIYNAISNDSLEDLRVIDSIISIKLDGKDCVLPKIDAQLKSRIDEAILLLREANSDLVMYSAVRLVDITHKWWCWKQNYWNAQLLLKGSYPMSAKSIRESNKAFEI